MRAEMKSLVSRSAMSRDRKQIESVMKRLLSEQRKFLDRFPALEPQVDALHHIVMSPGKRIRPLLFAGSYRAFAGLDEDSELPEHVAQIGAALEIFHAFLLVHDDVIDQSSSRRGEPTLHKQIENQPRIRRRNAECAAIVLGDILQGYVFELLIQDELDAQTQRYLIRYVSKMIQLTGAGEAIEIHLWDQPIAEVSDSWIRSVYELKTAVYTFECPLLLGAVLAGAESNIQEIIQRVSGPLGIAFQIENDLHEISLDFDAFKEVAYDLKCGVKTLYLKKLYHTLDDADRTFIDRILAGKLCALEHQLRLHKLLQSPVTRAALQNEINRHFSDARDLIETMVCSTEHKVALNDLFSFILSNRKHSEAGMHSQATTFSAS